MTNKVKEHTALIKTKALELGFSSVGISRAGFLEEEAPRLEDWLHQGKHGSMKYMENHFDKRLDPTKLMEGAKSVISLSLNYFPAQSQIPGSYKISKYAYGTDYHFVIKDKLKTLLQFIQDEIGPVNGRGFVDSAPVLDKAWAKKGGLGWIGKHSNLIIKNQGSFYFLAELIVDLELEYEEKGVKDYCGTCTRCIDACPTEAITPYQVDGSKCISYFTIELKEAIPTNVSGKLDDWIFGCDICQDVCPWNRFSKTTPHADFDPHPDLLTFSSHDWEEITQEIFSEIFRKSAVKRTKFSGLKRNIEFVSAGKKD